jgi:hypothetical protein
LVIGVLGDLVRLALFDPRVASLLGALVTGQPQLGPELIHICERESHCRPVGAHKRDMQAGPTMYRNAMRVGWLDDECIFHRGDPKRFSTRGVHGMAAAYTLRWLPCSPPEVLDIPLVSAIAASRRAEHQCVKKGACSRVERHRQWTGPRKWDRREARATKQP